MFTCFGSLLELIMYARTITRPLDVILPPEEEGGWILETEQTAGMNGGANE